MNPIGFFLPDILGGYRDIKLDALLPGMGNKRQLARSPITIVGKAIGLLQFAKVGPPICEFLGQSVHGCTLRYL